MPKTKKALVLKTRSICRVLCSSEFPCPVCGQVVPPNTLHECENDGGVRTVRNRPQDRIDPVAAITQALLE